MPFKCFMQFVMGILSLEFPIPNADALNEKAQKERYVWTSSLNKIAVNFNHPFIHYSQHIYYRTTNAQK